MRDIIGENSNVIFTCQSQGKKGPLALVIFSGRTFRPEDIVLTGVCTSGFATNAEICNLYISVLIVCIRSRERDGYQLLL